MHMHTNRENVDSRLAKVEGHVKSIRKMLDEKECEDILIQLSAVQGAIKQISMLILEDHLAHCVIEDVKDGNEQEVVQKLTKAIKYVIKSN